MADIKNAAREGQPYDEIMTRVRVRGAAVSLAFAVDELTEALCSLRRVYAAALMGEAPDGRAVGGELVRVGRWLSTMTPERYQHNASGGANGRA